MLHDQSCAASPEYAGPQALEALAAAQRGHQVAYGADAYTERLQAVVREHFGEQATRCPCSTARALTLSASPACCAGEPLEFRRGHCINTMQQVILSG